MLELKPESTREPMRVTRARGDEQSPAWAPDGKRIAYFALREGLGSVWVSAIDARGETGGAVRARPAPGPVLASRRGGFPAWSPDGRTILIGAVPDPEPVYNGNPLRSAVDAPPLFVPDAFDLWSVPLSMGAVLPVIYGVKESAAHSLDARNALLIAVLVLPRG